MPTATTIARTKRACGAGSRADARLIVYRAVVGLSWLVFFILWAILALVYRDGKDRRRDSWLAHGIRLLFVVAIVFSMVSLEHAPVLQFGELAGRFQAFGAVLSLAGVAFAGWARVAIGRSWGMPMTRHESPELVTSGPYRLVRHPIYTGLIAMWIGTSLVYPFAAVYCGLVIVYMIFASLREERDMQQQFPDVYPAYKQRSKMLVPFIF